MPTRETPTSHSVSYKIETDPRLVEPFIATIQAELEAFGILDKVVRLRVSIALQESLINALFHGNLECSSDLRQVDDRDFYELAQKRCQVEPYRSRCIYFEASVDGDRAEFSIVDEGPGFDIEILNKKIDPSDPIRIGGRGFLLIRAFMDEVYVSETGNRITLVKHLTSSTDCISG